MNRTFFGRTAIMLAAAVALLASTAATASAQPMAKPLAQISHVEAASSSPFPWHD